MLENDAKLRIPLLNSQARVYSTTVQLYSNGHHDLVTQFSDPWLQSEF